MRRALAFGLVVGTLLPVAAHAQDGMEYSSGQKVLQSGVAKAPTPLPVTLDVASPDYAALAQINSNPTLGSSAPVGSPAATALNAGVNSGIPTQLPGTYPTAAVSADGSVGANGVKPPSADATNGGLLERLPPVYNWRHNTGPFRDWLRLYEPTAFAAGNVSLEYGTQYWSSPIWFQSANAAKMLPQMVRIGYQLNDPATSRFERLKGTFEVLGEVDTIPIVSGAGTYMIGGSGLIRYNAVVNHRIVPYFLVGFGGLYTDSAGQAGSPTSTNFNFITQFGTGSHFFLNDKWAIMMESSYTFIGNWGIGTGNGYHVLGGLVGITRYFGTPSR